MTPDDAQGLPETTESAETPAPESTEKPTASGTKDAEEFTPEKLPETEKAKFLKWADNYAAQKLRQEITKNGNALMKVPPAYKDRLRTNPNYIAELEAERDAFKRAALTGDAGPSQKVTEAASSEDVDDIEADAKAVLKARGISNEADPEAYNTLLRYEVEHLKVAQKRAERLLKRSQPVNVDKVLEEKLTAREVKRREEEAAAHWAEIQESPEFNSERGAEFEGRLNRKIRDAAEQGGPRKTLKQFAEEVKAEMWPTQAGQKRARVSSGDTSSGKVGVTAGSDPWADLRKLEAEMKAKGEEIP